MEKAFLQNSPRDCCKYQIRCPLTLRLYLAGLDLGRGRWVDLRLWIRKRCLCCSWLLCLSQGSAGLGVCRGLGARCCDVEWKCGLGPFSQTEQRLRKVWHKITDSCLTLTALCLGVLSPVMGDRRPGEAPCWGCPAGLGEMGLLYNLASF